ncbi:MAG: Copper binding protein, plastocyanin/azurin family [Dehalococcoidia bacterium]|nr:Copper binding protein, plastocyanin/azurin family [Dehalococcoidia bacterium]
MGSVTGRTGRSAMRLLALGGLALIALMATVTGYSLALAQPTLQDVSITLTNFAIAPKEITVSQGQPVKFIVTNGGQNNHNLTFKLEAQQIEKKLFEANVAPGGNNTGEYTFSTVGEWQMYCPVGTHAQQGMTGTVKVVAGSVPSTLPKTGDSQFVNVLLVFSLAGLSLLSGGALLRRRMRSI